jgi:hypothetical protein
MVKCPYCGSKMVGEHVDIQTGKHYYFCPFCKRTFELPELKAGVIERVATEKKEVIKERGKKAIEEMKEKFKEWGERWPKLGKIGRGAKTAATWMSVPFILGFTAGEERRKKLWEMARGKPEVYSLLAKPTPYQIFGEFLFVLAIVLFIGGNWPAAFALFLVGFLILSVYTSPILVVSVFPICALVYLLWFGPIPTFPGVAFTPTLFAIPFLIIFALATKSTALRAFFFIIAVILAIIWLLPGLLWTPGYPDWLKEIKIPLAGTTPNAYLSKILPIPLSFVTILGWVIVILTFHVVYSSTLASPTLAQEPGRVFFGNLLTVFAIFFILGVNWIEVFKGVMRVDIYSCFFMELTKPENIAKGISVWEAWEKCKKVTGREYIPIHKFGSYTFPLQMKLTSETLDMKPTPITPGEFYPLFFTVVNTGEKEMKIKGMFVNNFTGCCNGEAKVENCDKYDNNRMDCENSGICYWVEDIKINCTSLPCFKLNETLCKKAEGCKWEFKEEFNAAPACDWKPENTLRVGETRCMAEVFIPSEYSSYTPKVQVNFGELETDCIERVRILESYEYYDKYYKPICLTSEGKNYYCPAVTEGPVDPIIAFNPRQFVKGAGLPLILIIRISNEQGGGVASFKSIEIVGLEKLIPEPPEKCENPLNFMKVDGKPRKELKPGEIADDIICKIAAEKVKSPAGRYEEVLITAKAKYYYNQTFSLTTIQRK